MFAYDNAITERFPTIRSGVVYATGLTNEPSQLQLLEGCRAEQQAAADRGVGAALADLDSLLASYQSQGRTESWMVSPTNHRTGTSEGAEVSGGDRGQST